MIPRVAVRKFIKRPRKDYSWYKDLTDEEIERRMRKLPVRPPIWNKLRKHQKICLLIGARFGHWCFWNDTGTGKSLLSIALLRYFQALLQSNRPELVLVPNKVNKAEWAREIKKHSANTKYCILRGSSELKWEQLLTTRASVVIETYAGLVRMICDRVKLRRKKKGKVRHKLKPSAKKFTLLQKLIEGPIFDESEAIGGGRSSIAYRICKKLSWQASHAFALNGTPFGRDPEPLWAQMHVIDKGKTLGETLGLFRAVFYKEVQTGWGFPEYKFNHKKEKLLHQWIANRSTRYAVDESELPKRVQILKPFILSVEARAYYDKALTALRQAQIAKGLVKERKNEFLRLRQLSSGFLGFFDDEEGKRAQIEFPNNPKLDLCISKVQEIVRGHKVVIFHDFTYSGHMISRELSKLKIPHSRLYGATKDPDAQLMKFVEDNDCRAFVLNSQAGGKGLNLQVARYVIYYESPVRVVIRIQTERRVVRQESEHKKAIIYDLVMKGGVDERILEFHAEGRDLLQAVLDGKVSL